jgi:hypothetical protein
MTSPSNELTSLIEGAASEGSTESRRAARERVLSWYLHTADNANRALAPHRRHVTLPALPAGVTPLRFDQCQARDELV